MSKRMFPHIFSRDAKARKAGPLCALLVLLCGACGGGDILPLHGSGELPEGKRLDGMDPSLVLSAGECRTPNPGSTPLRRLTNSEYQNSLLALGIPENQVRELVALLPQEPESLGFRNGASALTVNTLLAQRYKKIADQLAGEVAASCPQEQQEDECVGEVIQGLGVMLHRRPITAEESQGYQALFEKARQVESEQGAFSWVVRAMLQSPHFLYRVEIPGGAVEPVTGYEMASRLSYTFWQAPPDEELMRAAAAGELSTKEQVEAQVWRLLGDERAFRIYDFFEQWLGLDKLTRVERDESLYPGLNPRLAQLFKAESRSFIQSLLMDPDSTFSDLLRAKHTFVNEELAAHYGIEGIEGPIFQRVEAPGRSGVLTQGMLSVVDADTHTSIVRRGLKIRTDFLCQLVPAPPDNVDLTLDGIGADLTQAERLAQHREQPACAGCHALMDPIGTAFEGFDAVGRERTEDEHGSPVVTDGELAETIGANGPLSGVDELAERLAESIDGQQCYMLQHFRYFFGREAQREDLCSQAQLTKIFQDGELRLVDLLVAIARSDAFLYKAALVQGPAGEEASP